MLYEDDADGGLKVTGLKVGQAGKERLVTADAYVAALDVPGIQRFVPAPWRERWQFFDNIYKLVGVPVITVQLRCARVPHRCCTLRAALRAAATRPCCVTGTGEPPFFPPTLHLSGTHLSPSPTLSPRCVTAASPPSSPGTTAG